MNADGDDNPVEQLGALADHVEMAEGERIEGAGVDGGARRGAGHGRGIGDFGRKWEGR